MQSALGYWLSALVEAFAKTTTDIIGKTREDIVRDVVVLALAFVIARWGLHSRVVANESIIWTMSIVAAFGCLFLFILLSIKVAQPCRVLGKSWDGILRKCA